MKIYVKYWDVQAFPVRSKKGDWIDLRSNEEVVMKAPFAHTLSKKRDSRNVEFDYHLISLGIAMKLPKGLEAIVVPRSSTYKNFHILQANSFGVIDNCYNGNDDQWKFPAIALADTTIHIGDRICQFRIQPSQFATPWQKLKWLFTKNIKFVRTSQLNKDSRGGIGSTGVN